MISLGNLLCLVLCATPSIVVTGCLAIIVIRAFQLDQSDEATLFTSMTSVSSHSLAHCATLCIQRSDCLTFRFFPDTSVCQTSNEEPGGLGSGVAVFSTGLRSRSDLSQCKRLVSSASSQLSCTIQQRVSGSVSFQQPWTSYQTGFGDASNFWIGLQAINHLTSLPGKTLLVDTVNWSDQILHQEYSKFYVLNSSSNYTMKVGSMIAAKSNMADFLYINSGTAFSTYDSDNDASGGSCSCLYHGRSGWWFRSCGNVNPNGIYVNGSLSSPNYMAWWYSSSSGWWSLKAVRLMLAV